MTQFSPQAQILFLLPQAFTTSPIRARPTILASKIHYGAKTNLSFVLIEKQPIYQQKKNLVLPLTNNPSMLMIRSSHSTDSSTLMSELEGDDNHPLNLYTSSDYYVQPNGISRTSYIFPAHNGLGSFGTDGPRKNIQGCNRLSTFRRYSPECIKCGRESFDLTKLRKSSETAG